MIADLKLYPATKDSGVEWLGQVPEHWRVRRGKWLFRNKKQVNVGGAETNVLSLTLRGVVNNDPDNPEGLVPKDYATYQLFHKGDLVFKLIDLENLRTSRVGLVHEDGIMSSAYVRLTAKVDLDTRFFYRQYFDLYQRGIYNQLGAGVRSTLGPRDLLELKVLAPPLSEQGAIVQYLDYVDRRVRRLVLAKRKLIALLTEQKQAVIHRAVTCGLDPDVPLKDSGVEWLSEVPEHWEVRRLKDLLASPMRNGLFKKKHAYGSGVPLINVADVYQGDFEIDPSVLERVEATEEERATYRVEWGDLFFVRSSLKLEGTGRSAVAMHCEPSTVFECHLVRARADKRKVSPRFLALQLNSHGFANYLVSRANVVTMATVAQGTLSASPVVLPPLPEQEAIISHLGGATADIDTVIARANREIELLNEYRTRVIADVVTGKLDVREAAAALPEVDPLAAEDEQDDALEADDAADLDESDAIPEGAES